MIHAPFDDHELTSAEERIARYASLDVLEALRRGHRVLVTCEHGRNRSGLVCALALVKLGWHPYLAVDLIQEQRSGALRNGALTDLIYGI